MDFMGEDYGDEVHASSLRLVTSLQCKFEIRMDNNRLFPPELRVFLGVLYRRRLNREGGTVERCSPRQHLSLCKCCHSLIGLVGIESLRCSALICSGCWLPHRHRPLLSQLLVSVLRLAGRQVRDHHYDRRRLPGWHHNVVFSGVVGSLQQQPSGRGNFTQSFITSGCRATAAVGCKLWHDPSLQFMP